MEFYRVAIATASFELMSYRLSGSSILIEQK